MSTPQACPICQSEELERYGASGTFLPDGEFVHIIGFRCGNGHVFYVQADSTAASQSG